MDTRDEVVLALTDDTENDPNMAGLNSPSTQRLVLTGHFIFRITAILIYLFCAWFTTSFVLPFVFILVCLSLDFWVVKNISGRVLVGLRWSSYTDEQGRVQWRFDARQPSPLETADPITLSRRELAARSMKVHYARLFWVGLWGAPLFWLLLILGALFSLNLKWALVSVIAFGMTAANLYGYLRCRFSNMGEGSSSLYNLIQSSSAQKLFATVWATTPKTDSTASASTSTNKDGATILA